MKSRKLFRKIPAPERLSKFVLFLKSLHEKTNSKILGLRFFFIPFSFLRQPGKQGH